MENHIFWSEIGSGFWEPCGKFWEVQPPPTHPATQTERFSTSRNDLVRRFVGLQDFEPLQYQTSLTIVPTLYFAVFISFTKQINSITRKNTSQSCWSNTHEMTHSKQQQQQQTNGWHRPLEGQPPYTCLLFLAFLSVCLSECVGPTVLKFHMLFHTMGFVVLSSKIKLN